MMGSEMRSIPRISIICGVHSASIFARSAWNGAASGPCMMRGPGCAAGESGPSGGGGTNALISWWPKPTTLSTPHIAADHPLRQAWLERLIDDTATPAEISFAVSHEVVQRQLLQCTATLRMEHLDRLRT